MDITMPGMDGYTLMSHLSSDGATRDIPVIIVSGKDSLKETFQQFTGVAEFFSKPFDIKVLRDRVQEIIAKRGR
jgi:CheY-like chemotaxis protein